MKAVLCKHLFTTLALFVCWSIAAYGQSDNCGNATDIPIFQNGFATGTLSPTPPADFSLATVEPGENFSPIITAAGQTQKSMWYRFTLPTTRSVSLVLGQFGSLIAPGDVGLTVYKTSSCLPADSFISTKLLPITTFDTTSSTCVEAGTYLVQVSSKSSANGFVYLQLILDQPNAAYDLTTQAYNFGTLASGTKSINYAVDCQSTEDITEFCTSLKNSAEYNKSSWHVFRTPSSFDKIVFSVSPQNAMPGQIFGYRLYKGDVRISAVTVITSCDSLKTDVANVANRSYTCSQLLPNTIYSVELFFQQDFKDNIEVSLTTAMPTIQNNTVTTCGTSYQLPWGTVVFSNGIYSDTIKAAAGCDSLINTVDLSFVNGSTVVNVQNKKDTICNGAFYTLPWGANVSQAGQYKDTVRYLSGCDSLIRIVDLFVNGLITDTTNVSICEAQNYTLGNGNIVNVPGFYSDTVRYKNFACDSLIKVIHLSINNSSTIRDTVSLCSGGSYTLPWGELVTNTGEYRDTLKGIAGCDSLIQIFTINFNQPITKNISASVCAGQTYTMPSGGVISIPGIYKDTIKAAAGCDSVLTTIDLTNITVTKADTVIAICDGQMYTLPSGALVSAQGIYTDTIKTLAGCDSLVRSITIVIKKVVIINDVVQTCAGKPYTSPWGAVVTMPGVYRDTIRYLTGCDSLIRNIDLSTTVPVIDSTDASFCIGNSYMLPWGAVVTLPGIYSDTARYVTGCDSLINIINLSATVPVVDSTDASFCSGATYTLPWGVVVNNKGIYTDTSKTNGGCDSLIRVVNLTENNILITIDSASICENGSYMLPWGTMVNLPGLYEDTLRHVAGGCDSIIRKVFLQLNNASVQNMVAYFCAGTAYMLPWGTSVTSSGIYTDTIKNIAGCDSVIRSVNLLQQNLITQSVDTSICNGDSYILPWGEIVNTSGMYRDTIRSSAGCDSVLQLINLSIKPFTTQTTNAIINAGENYILPWGIGVTVAGTYKDTLHYTTGCDSLIEIINLNVNTIQMQTIMVSICNGSTYTLPWGTVVSSAGIYRDTIRTITGKDSIIREVNLSIQISKTQFENVSICSGQSYILPWGKTATASGIYTDTLYSSAGCDSLINIVNLKVDSTIINTAAASICFGETYILPWGKTVMAGGVYNDTIKNIAGCDSLIQTVDLTVNPSPVVQITKSNDINCMIGSAKLTATGNGVYSWSPSGTLSDATIYNPVATPTVSTMYKLKVSAGNGCVTEDSIFVMVNAADPENGYLVANAFTPNNDGLNDCFGIQHWGVVTDLDFSIFNRWGQLIFHTSNAAECWDGTYKNAQLPSGTFVYLIRAKTICGVVQRKGTVTLIR